MPIYHIAYAADWDRARTDGAYMISTRGRTLAQEGFIHASQTHQVAPVANRFYGADDALVVLVIDVDRLRSEVRHEEVPGAEGDPFPHIYGPLNIDAVVDVLPLPKGPDGRYAFP